MSDEVSDHGDKELVQSTVARVPPLRIALDAAAPFRHHKGPYTATFYVRALRPVDMRALGKGLDSGWIPATLRDSHVDPVLGCWQEVICSTPFRRARDLPEIVEICDSGGKTFRFGDVTDFYASIGYEMPEEVQR